MQGVKRNNDYNLNGQTLDFINRLGEKSPNGTVYTTTELIDMFKQSRFYDEIITTYYKSALNKSISHAISNSPYWTRTKRGINERRNTSVIQSDNKPDKNSKKRVQKKKKSYSNVNNDWKNYSIDIVTNSQFREELIQFLSANIFEVIMLKKNIKDDGLRQYHFTKGIGEDLYFLTESFYRQKNVSSSKYYISDFITEEAVNLIRTRNTRNNLTYEHMVPKNLYLSVIASKALEGTLTEQMVYELLNKYFYVCTIAKHVENNKLPATSMGAEWNQEDPFYRYKSAGINFYPNIFNQLYFS